MSVPNDELEQIFGHLNDKNKVVAKSFLSWLLEKQIDEEDEYLTPEDIQAIEQAQLDLQSGNTKSLEDLQRELEI
jgi:transcription elongation factor GreA-like protein